MKHRKSSVDKLPALENQGGFFNSMDITQALRGWAFQPGQVNVRLIRGNDGKAKVQLRLDLGLLQMELEGRPDGKRPHRAATELEFQRKRLHLHHQRAGSDAGFTLTTRDCAALREESAMFYHRYLSLFVLEQYEAVIRDTQHNLDVLDMCHRYGRNDYDRMFLEQYRPYILMMNVRAKTCEALRRGFIQTAVAYLRGGIRQIARLASKENRRKYLRQSSEARILMDMLQQIRAQMPADPRAELRRRLRDAVRTENYERAASIRDQLIAMTDAITRKPRKIAGEARAARGADIPKSQVPARRPRKPRSRKGDQP